MVTDVMRTANAHCALFAGPTAFMLLAYLFGRWP